MFYRITVKYVVHIKIRLAAHSIFPLCSDAAIRHLLLKPVINHVKLHFRWKFCA